MRLVLVELTEGRRPITARRVAQEVHRAVAPPHLESRSFARDRIDPHRLRAEVIEVAGQDDVPLGLDFPQAGIDQDPVGRDALGAVTGGYATRPIHQVPLLIVVEVLGRFELDLPRRQRADRRRVSRPLRFRCIAVIDRNLFTVCPEQLLGRQRLGRRNHGPVRQARKRVAGLRRRHGQLHELVIVPAPRRGRITPILGQNPFFRRRRLGVERGKNGVRSKAGLLRRGRLDRRRSLRPAIRGERDAHANRQRGSTQQPQILQYQRQPTVLQFRPCAAFSALLHFITIR